MITALFQGPLSFSGHPLAGDRLLRFIYVDEAGTSQHEPVAVVAGVLINADKQWRRLETHLSEIRNEFLPRQDREGFVFHATELFSGGKYFNRSKWPLSVRLDILKAILSSRPLIDVSVSFGYSFKTEDSPYKSSKNYTSLRHVSAYALCLIGCEKYLREFGEPDEVATVVAEENREVRRHIKLTHADITNPRTEFPGFSDVIPFRHIVDTVHFADKRSSALLQYADAFAFAFRRYAAGLEYADELMDAIKGPLPSRPMAPLSMADYVIFTSSYSTDIMQFGVSSSFSVSS